MGACGGKPDPPPAPQNKPAPPPQQQKAAPAPAGGFSQEPIKKDPSPGVARRKSVAQLRDERRDERRDNGSASPETSTPPPRRMSLARRPSLARGKLDGEQSPDMLDSPPASQNYQVVEADKDTETESASESDTPENFAETAPMVSLLGLIDSEKYKKCFDSLHARLAYAECDRIDAVLCYLGFAVLHNLGGDAWRAPECPENIGSSQLKKAQRALDEMLIASNQDSAAAWLALAEYNNSISNPLEETRCRQLAKETGHPLAVLKYASSKVSHLNARIDDGKIEYNAYCTEIVQHVRDMYALTQGKEDFVAARAAKMTWGYFYKGKDGVPKDNKKAIRLLEMIVKFEKNGSSAAKYRSKLQKLKDKSGDDEARAASGTALGNRSTSLRSSVRRAHSTSPAAPGLNASPSNFASSGRLRGMSSVNRAGGTSPVQQNLGRRRSSTSGLGRLNQSMNSNNDSMRWETSSVRSKGGESYCSSVNETVLEMNVQGMTFGVIKEGDGDDGPPRGARMGRRGTVTQHDADELDDGDRDGSTGRTPTRHRSGSRIGLNRSNRAGSPTETPRTARRGEEHRRNLRESGDDDGSLVAGSITPRLRLD